MIKKAIQFWLDFLFPKNCLLCQEGNEYLCQKCFRNLKFKDPHCPNCDNNSKIGIFCDKCRDKFELKGVLVAGDFNDKNLATLIKYYKYNFIKELGNYLGLFLVNFLNNNIRTNPIMKNNNSELNLDLDNYLIIPVPLSKKRLRWRGFNQSQILAKKIGGEIGLKISLDLVRVKHRTAQAKLNKKGREENLKNCFKWKGENLKEQKIIIVDDVYTTGSTLNEVAQELKKHQAGEIWGLVLAKG
ncbi:MAG: double zinc ribbon domain-containing protein [Patescibacteria group bacterium]|nr:double zinc ribbon domain-containing protein [Patescibacteria group bacterium]